jgi:hypothetical protein
MWNTGALPRDLITYHHSDGGEWGLPTASGEVVGMGIVKPLGVCYQPVYSFALQATYSNYTRTANVGFVTDYVVQIAARTTAEHAIMTGDVVCVADGHFEQGSFATTAIQAAGQAGSFKRLADVTPPAPSVLRIGDLALAQEMVVGRCLKSFIVADSDAAGPQKFKDDTGTITVNQTAKDEFKGLNLVETRGTVAGSGTQGLPGHILEGLSDSGGKYRLLTLLIRM